MDPYKIDVHFIGKLPLCGWEGHRRPHRGETVEEASGGLKGQANLHHDQRCIYIYIKSLCKSTIGADVVTGKLHSW